VGSRSPQERPRKPASGFPPAVGMESIRRGANRRLQPYAARLATLAIVAPPCRRLVQSIKLSQTKSGSRDPETTYNFCPHVGEGRRLRAFLASAAFHVRLSPLATFNAKPVNREARST
jgi:hypothetical protein